MTLVYDNTTCEQAIFTYAFSGQNLNKDNIVFTVKKLVDFMFMVFIIIVLVVENWLIGLITMMNLLIIS